MQYDGTECELSCSILRDLWFFRFFNLFARNFIYVCEIYRTSFGLIFITSRYRIWRISLPSKGFSSVVVISCQTLETKKLHTYSHIFHVPLCEVLVAAGPSQWIVIVIAMLHEILFDTEWSKVYAPLSTGFTSENVIALFTRIWLFLNVEVTSCSISHVGDGLLENDIEDGLKQWRRVHSTQFLAM